MKFKNSKDLTNREWRSRQKQQKKWNLNRRVANGRKSSDASDSETDSREAQDDDVEMMEQGEIDAGSTKQKVEELRADVDRLKKSIRKKGKKVSKKIKQLKGEKKAIENKVEAQRKKIKRLDDKLQEANAKLNPTSPLTKFKQSIKGSDLTKPLKEQIVSFQHFSV